MLRVEIHNTEKHLVPHSELHVPPGGGPEALRRSFRSCNRARTFAVTRPIRCSAASPDPAGSNAAGSPPSSASTASLLTSCAPSPASVPTTLVEFAINGELSLAPRDRLHTLIRRPRPPLTPSQTSDARRRSQARPEGAGEARVAVRNEHVRQPHVAEHRPDQVARRHLGGGS